MRIKDIGKSLNDERKVLRNGLILLVCGAALVLLVLRFDQVWGAVSTVISTLSPVAFGIVLAYVLNVFVHFFEDFAFLPLKNVQSPLWRKARRPLAVLLAYLVVALVIVFICAFIVPGLIESVRLLADTVQQTAPVYFNSAVKWLTKFAAENDLTFIQDFLSDFSWPTLLGSFTTVATNFLTSLLDVTFNVASGVFSFIMGFIFSVYMLVGKEKLLRGVRSTALAFLPKGAARRLGRVGRVANQVFFSFIKGQLTECVILGTLCYVGMGLLGLQYALLISSVVALSSLIPILGAYIGAAVGVFILLLVHPIDALVFLIFLLVLQQVEGNLIYPRVVGSSIGLPPVWTLFAVLFWGGVLGIPGILLGTPTTAVLYRLLRTGVRRRLRERGMDPDDPSLVPASLRAATQEKEESPSQGE